MVDPPGPVPVVLMTQPFRLADAFGVAVADDVLNELVDTT